MELYCSSAVVYIAKYFSEVLVSQIVHLFTFFMVIQKNVCFRWVGGGLSKSIRKHTRGGATILHATQLPFLIE